MLTKEIKEKWLTNLRSGKFEQGYGTLCFEDRYCVLGVFYVTMDAPKEIYTRYINDSYNNKFDADYSLAAKYLTGKEIEALYRMNDSRIDFKEIADWIEQNISTMD